MANRSVSVELTLRAEQYKTEVEEAALRTERLKSATEKADRQVDELGRDAVKSAAGLRVLGVEVDSLHRKMREGLSSGTNALNDWFNPTELPSGLGGWAGALAANPAGWAGIAAAAGALGVMIGGAVVTGIGLAGIGGGIALQLHDARVQAALGDLKTDVSSGLKDASASFAEPLAKGIGILDQGLVSNVLPKLKVAFAALAPEVTDLAHGSVGFLSGVTTGLEHVMVASKPLVSEFSQWLPQFGNQLGGVFGQMAQHSKEAQQGLYMLEDTISGLTNFAAGAIPVLSKLFDGLKYINTYTEAESVIGRLYNVDPSAIHGKGIGGLATDFTDAANHAADLNTTLGIQLGYWDKIYADVTKVAGGFDKVFGITMSVQQAQLGLAQSITGLSDSIAKNGDHWDINTKAGQANRAAVIQEEQAILALRDANIKAGMSADDANAKYEDQQTALRKTLTALGLTKQQVDDLIGAYAKVPDKVDTTVNTPGLGSAQAAVSAYHNNWGTIPETVPTYVNTPGLGSASSAVAQYRDYIASIPKTVMTYFVSTYSTLGPSSRSASQNRWGGIYQHAEAGLLNAGIYSAQSPARYAFAEPATGGEAFIPRFGDYGRSTAILDQAARWYGGRFMAGGMGGGAVRVEMAFTGAAAGSLGSVIMGMVRTGDIQIKTSQLVPG